MESLALKWTRLVPIAGLVAAAAAFAGPPEYADVMVQGGGGVLAENGMMVKRQPKGLRISSSIPTPAPGSYQYPAGGEVGHPEVFTLWAFIFNYPELCSDNDCGMNDLGNTMAQGGAYNVGGHAVGSGGMLNIAGRIAVGEEPFAGVPLQSPETAEVHTAIAPHGALDPSTLPGEFRSPTGPSSIWWVGIIY